MRELDEKEIKQVAGGANGFTTENHPPGNPDKTVEGGGVGLIQETKNRGDQTVNGQKFRDDVPPPG
jgi:hypothetical protein